ncbi:hypothetical protein [Thioalkalivibrio sp. ALJ16]|uniref:hypothetical protein n=1 Tax=Thioalkalivibrio sp. ALJ16 TaxID=1158762 RepID=UPI0012DEFB9E|nr:hypothetical protein [Thioalkalivibrio sp. ALJ16]
MSLGGGLEIVDLDESDRDESFVKRTIVDSVKKHFNRIKVENRKKGFLLIARKKDLWGGSLVALRANVDIRIKDGKAKVLIEKEFSKRWLFWFYLLVCVLLIPFAGIGILFLMAQWVWHSCEKRRYSDDFDKSIKMAMNRIRFD